MGPYEKILERVPSPLDFPSNFNPHAVTIWFSACSHLPSNIRSAWIRAIQLYRAGCKSADLSPFADSKQDTDIAVRNYLFRQRKKFVLCMNVTRLLQDLKPIRLLTREAHVEHYGFSLEISMQFQLDDPTWVSKLKNLGFGYRFSTVREQRRYHMDLDPGLTVFVWNTSISTPRRWHIGYLIRCPIVPVYKSDDPLSTAAKEQYILDSLWRPLMDTYRARRLNRIRHL